MYVYLGGNVVIPTKDVVAILDARTIPASEINRELLARAGRGGQAHGRADAGRSLVVTTHGVYFSGLATATIARRMAQFSQSTVSGGSPNVRQDKGFARLTPLPPHAKLTCAAFAPAYARF